MLNCLSCRLRLGHWTARFIVDEKNIASTSCRFPLEDDEYPFDEGANVR